MKDYYNQKTIFHLPGLFHFTLIYEVILNAYKNHPEVFRDNVVIGSIYDSPGCIWNGGRLTLHPESKTSLEYVKNMMETFNIPIRFTFTNCLLQDEHLYDSYGNLLLEMFRGGNNEILCNSSILEEYIREKYNDEYKYISSTTKRLVDQTEQINELKKGYYLTVIDYDHNKNFDFLNNIDNKDNCELLCNAICQANCPYREEHYKNISKCQLSWDSESLEPCKYPRGDNIIFASKQDNFISVEDINDKYLPMGFSNFKLEGRTANPLDIVEILIYYLIKDEYQIEFRTRLHSLIWNIIDYDKPIMF